MKIIDTDNFGMSRASRRPRMMWLQWNKGHLLEPGKALSFYKGQFENSDVTFQGVVFPLEDKFVVDIHALEVLGRDFLHPELRYFNELWAARSYLQNVLDYANHLACERRGVERGYSGRNKFK